VEDVGTDLRHILVHLSLVFATEGRHEHEGFIEHVLFVLETVNDEGNDHLSGFEGDLTLGSLEDSLESEGKVPLELLLSLRRGVIGVKGLLHHLVEPLDVLGEEALTVKRDSLDQVVDGGEGVDTILTEIIVDGLVGSIVSKFKEKVNGLLHLVGEEVSVHVLGKVLGDVGDHFTLDASNLTLVLLDSLHAQFVKFVQDFFVSDEDWNI